MLLPARPAVAHPEFAPARSNRYLKLSLSGGGGVRLAYTVMIGELPAAEGRRLADLNGDGVVDPREQHASASALTDLVDRGLSLRVDGQLARVAWEPPAIGGFEDPRVGPIPYSIDLVGRIATGRGEHTVTLDDQTTFDALGDTELRIEEGPAARLVTAWQARDDGKLQTRFLFRGPKRSVIEDRSIGFRFVDASEEAGPREGWSRKRLGALAAAAAATVLGVAFVVWRGRRGRRGGPPLPRG